MIDLRNQSYIQLSTEIKKGSIKVIVTDPPYIHEKGGRGKMLLGDSLDRNKFNMKELGNFGENQIKEFLNLTKPLMEKPQWYIFCSEKQIVYYLNWALKNKMKYNILTWNKPLSVMNRERYSTNIEYIIRIYSSGCALNKIDLEKNPEKAKMYSKYKSYNQIRGAKKLHPSQKPVEMLMELIELSSDIGDTIFDPFMGSASTGEACYKLGRNFIGSELEKEIYEKAKERMENLQNGN